VVAAHVRTTLGALVLLSVGCITNRMAPGVLRERDWNQSRRDPDPTRIPDEPLPVSPESTTSGQPDSQVVDLVKRSAATFLAWAASGAVPLVELSGTFEETPEAPATPDRPPAASDDAE
jgi:hypothetical protein